MNTYAGSVVTTHAFTIEAAWWQTAWFYLLATFAVVFILVLVISTRERSIKQEQQVAHWKLQTEYETLRSQVNPHFLFNSFNTLTNIIEESPDRAVEYVEHLSDFFRNMLEIREQPLVTLRHELLMTTNYLYLQQKRFGSNFAVTQEIPVSQDDYVLPPLTLQIIMENAFKHNIVSRDTPLRIHMSVNGQTLEVRNNVNPKAIHESSTGLGLKIREKQDRHVYNPIHASGVERKYIYCICSVNKKI